MEFGLIQLSNDFKLMRVVADCKFTNATNHYSSDESIRYHVASFTSHRFKTHADGWKAPIWVHLDDFYRNEHSSDQISRLPISLFPSHLRELCLVCTDKPLYLNISSMDWSSLLNLDRLLLCNLVLDRGNIEPKMPPSLTRFDMIDCSILEERILQSLLRRSSPHLLKDVVIDPYPFAQFPEVADNSIVIRNCFRLDFDALQLTIPHSLRVLKIQKYFPQSLTYNVCKNIICKLRNLVSLSIESIPGDIIASHLTHLRSITCVSVVTEQNHPFWVVDFSKFPYLKLFEANNAPVEHLMCSGDGGVLKSFTLIADSSNSGHQTHFSSLISIIWKNLEIFRIGFDLLVNTRTPSWGADTLAKTMNVQYFHDHHPDCIDWIQWLEIHPIESLEVNGLLLDSLSTHITANADNPYMIESITTDLGDETDMTGCRFAQIIKNLGIHLRLLNNIFVKNAPFNYEEISDGVKCVKQMYPIGKSLFDVILLFPNEFVDHITERHLCKY